MSEPDETIVTALCISAFITAAFFCSIAEAATFSVLASQGFGAVVCIALLNLSCKSAGVWRCTFVQRDDPARGRFFQLCAIVPTALVGIDFLLFLNDDGCIASRCRSPLLQVSNFQLYYIMSWVGAGFIVMAIMSVLHFSSSTPNE